MAPKDRELTPGMVIGGRFRLERVIGRGGMGSVWAARQTQLDMPVAIKFMDPLALSPESRARFEREARAAAQLRSPHVVQIIDHGLDRELPFIVMELLEGEDLGERLRRERRLSVPAMSRILTQAAKGLRRAHEAKIIHRDMKPGNIYLARFDDDEVAKILDFGVAKMILPDGTDLQTAMTQTGIVFGSPSYMSPEQARGARVLDHRTDLWSLAVIVFRAVVGEKPFVGDSIGDLVIKLCIDPLPMASKMAPDLPPGIDDFFERAFAREPDERWSSAAEMAGAFARVAGLGTDGLVEALPPPPPLPAPPRPRGAVELGEVGLRKPSEAGTGATTVEPNASFLVREGTSQSRVNYSAEPRAVVAPELFASDLPPPRPIAPLGLEHAVQPSRLPPLPPVALPPPPAPSSPTHGSYAPSHDLRASGHALPAPSPPPRAGLMNASYPPPPPPVGFTPPSDDDVTRLHPGPSFPQASEAGGYGPPQARNGYPPPANGSSRGYLPTSDAAPPATALTSVAPHVDPSGPSSTLETQQTRAKSSPKAPPPLAVLAGVVAVALAIFVVAVTARHRANVTRERALAASAASAAPVEPVAEPVETAAAQATATVEPPSEAPAPTAEATATAEAPKAVETAVADAPTEAAIPVTPLPPHVPVTAKVPSVKPPPPSGSSKTGKGKKPNFGY